MAANLLQLLLLLLLLQPLLLMHMPLLLPLCAGPRTIVPALTVTAVAAAFSFSQPDPTAHPNGAASNSPADPRRHLCPVVPRQLLSHHSPLWLRLPVGDAEHLPQPLLLLLPLLLSFGIGLTQSLTSRLVILHRWLLMPKLRFPHPLLLLLSYLVLLLLLHLVLLLPASSLLRVSRRYGVRTPVPQHIR